MRWSVKVISWKWVFDLFMNGSGGVWFWDDDGGYFVEELLVIVFFGLNGKI